MADTNLQAGSLDDIRREVADLTGGLDLAQTRAAPANRPRQKAGLIGSPHRPRARVGGIAVLMTISSLLLASSSIFFGYRAIVEHNAVSSNIASAKTDRVDNVALPPDAQQVESTDKQAVIATNSIGGATRQPLPDAHVVTPLIIRNSPPDLSNPATQLQEKPDPESRASPSSTVATRAVEGSSPPTSEQERLKPAVAPAMGGEYAVQIASERSEQKAQATYRRLQTKYPSQLHGNPPIIRRADLGGGTYYRALAGPFASREMASKVCKALKAAGGDCILQKI